MNYQRIVVKVGTTTLTHPTGQLNIRRTEALVKVLSDLKNAGKELVLVTSGAIGIGAGKLGMRSRPTDLPTKQACAAVGQCELMYIYDKLFSAYNHTVSQLLLTRDAVDQTDRRENIENTFQRLLALGVIPIVNENDTVAVEEIVFGDNDTLSAIVAKAVGADLLILMSDIDGLYDANPKENPNAKLIPHVSAITPEILALAGGKGSEFGTGGMITKLHAAEIAMDSGCDMMILNGSDPAILYDVLDGKQVGTLFEGEKR
jgi:glutamate 5-kinase